jgi:hypothetical protein
MNIAYSNNGKSSRHVEAGWTLEAGGVLFDHIPTGTELEEAFPEYTAQSVAASQAFAAAAAMTAGLAITSAGTPALNSTYSVDQISQMNIIAIETSINAGKGFPGGSTTTFNYPDTAGVMHAFTEPNFTNFAAAVRDYVYALNSVIAGASSTLPATTATIA